MAADTPTISPANPDCIFCKIVAGQIPSHKLYEDEKVFSFLDVGPLSRGHCLVIPKAHYVTIDLMPDDLAAACLAVAPRISRALVIATQAAGWNILQNNGSVAGQAVGHVHFHLIPRTDGDGLGFRWPAGKLDTDDAAKLVNTITGYLNQTGD